MYRINGHEFPAKDFTQCREEDRCNLCGATFTESCSLFETKKCLDREFVDFDDLGYRWFYYPGIKRIRMEGDTSIYEQNGGYHCEAADRAKSLLEELGYKDKNGAQRGPNGFFI